MWAIVVLSEFIITVDLNSPEWSVFSEVSMTSWISINSHTLCLCLSIQRSLSPSPSALSLAPSCAFTCATPFTTELSARCVCVSVCLCACTCVLMKLTNLLLPLLPLRNQTRQTNEICMLSNLFHILLAVAFCRSFSRKVHVKTDKQLTVCYLLFMLSTTGVPAQKKSK